MASKDRRLEDKIERLENEITELRAKLNLGEAEIIELEMEKRELENENDDMHAELTRLRRQHAKTEADRKKCSAKYNNLLDELNMSSDELIKDLAYYRRKSDDLEKDLETERKTWQNTLKILEDENDQIISQKKDLRGSLDDLERKFEETRARNRDLEDDVELLNAEKEQAERAQREQELKTARLLNEQTGLNLRVQDMYAKQAKYKKKIRTMHSSRDHHGREEFTTEKLSKAMRNMDDEDSYYEDCSHKEDEYKYSRNEDDRKFEKRRPDRYHTRGGSVSPRGRSASPTPEWGN